MHELIESHRSDRNGIRSSNGEIGFFAVDDFWPTLRGHNFFIFYPIGLKFIHHQECHEFYNFHVDTEIRILHLHAQNSAQSQPFSIQLNSRPMDYNSRPIDPQQSTDGQNQSTVLGKVLCPLMCPKISFNSRTMGPISRPMAPETTF